MENGDVRTLSDEINRRQDFIADFSGNTALVIGLGGIGSWIAVDMALLGVGMLILFDDDIIEASNLNRTLFKLSQTGRSKAEAVKDLINERRKDIIVIINKSRFEVEMLPKYSSVDWIFDCSDTTRLKDLIRDLRESEESGNITIPKYVKLGYNGYEGTICMNDFNKGSWGEDSSYTITPSFFGTPQILSAVAVIEMVLKHKTQQKTVNMNVRNIVKLLESNR